MFHARVKNKETGRWRRLSADAFTAQIWDKGLAENYELFSEDGEVPLYFCPSGRRREGGARPPLRPHFAYMPGHAPDDHVFDRDGITHSFNEAVRSGDAILLNLNTDLSYRDLNCTAAASATAAGGISYHRWRAIHAGHYRAVSISTVQEAIRTIRSVNAALDGSPEFASRIFANYGGGVLPYDAFFIPATAYRDVAVDKRPGSVLPDLFNRLQGDAGVKITNGAARSVGMPRLLQFLPTKAMLDADNPQFIRGTPIDKFDAAGSYLFSQLIFSDDEDVRGSAAYGELVRQVRENPQGVYVLASPSITIYPLGEEALHKGKMLRWIINDIGAQTVPAGEVSSRERKAHSDPQPV